MSIQRRTHWNESASEVYSSLEQRNRFLWRTETSAHSIPARLQRRILPDPLQMGRRAEVDFRADVSGRESQRNICAWWTRGACGTLWGLSEHHRRLLVPTSSSVAVCLFVFCPVVLAARRCASPHPLGVGFDGCCCLAAIR